MRNGRGEMGMGKGKGKVEKGMGVRACPGAFGKHLFIIPMKMK